MRSRQRQLSNQQSNVPPVPTTLWYRLPTSSQQQLAHLVAELIQRVRTAAQDKERDYEC
jgi:hypothetical protein